MLLFLIICHVNLWLLSTCIQRVYYVGLKEVTWDYAPRGNLLRKNDRTADIYLRNDPSIPSIGTKYTKAVYVEYTDSTFTTQKQHPQWMGVLGVLFKGEIGDYIVVHFHNMAAFNHSFTLHPHGVFYNKDNEGARYEDGTSASDKQDDGVAPGKNYTYVWMVHPDYGPTPADPDCIPWLVHSHQFPEEEVHTGALAMMATCKKGVLDDSGNRKIRNVKEFAFLFMMFDENFSLYLQQNKNIYLPDVNSDYITKNFDSFHKSNQKYSINGYIYGNLPGLEVSEDDTVILYLAVVGNDNELETVNLQGHNMLVYNHRVATVGVYPGSSMTAVITKLNPGKWILSSQSVSFIEAGMQAFFIVTDTVSKIPDVNTTSSILKSPEIERNQGRIRRYYITAEEIWWNYAPSKFDIVNNVPLQQHQIANVSFGTSTRNNCKLNGQYKKALFKGYVDPFFQIPLPVPRHLGFLGPPVKAEVGDTVLITFYNRASKNYSLQAYRFFAPVDENGILYDQGPNVIVQPNQKRTYTWKVPESVGPTEEDADCLVGRYYSAVNAVLDTYSGLTGPLLVCKKQRLQSVEEWVDREFFLSFSDVDETSSHYFEESVRASCPQADINVLRKDSEFLQANLMRSLNGRVYGNLEDLVMCRGDRVNWYMMSVGNAMQDLHTPYFHGNTLRINGASKDTYALIPDTFVTASMIPENPGIWSLEDQVMTFQGMAQMEFLYEVRDCSYTGTSPQLPFQTGKIRNYYIAVVEKIWDYAPLNHHLITGDLLSENHISQLYYNRNRDMNMIGHQYVKALYREFTDGTFKVEKKRDERDLHLGTLGPFIKAEVGDTVRVVFKNMASFNFSIMPHELFYTKSNEGYSYNDNVSPNRKSGARVAPGSTFTYNWYVPERSGPGPDDFNCITSAYLSHVDYATDINAGLVGPLVICKKGILDDNGRRTDVDREWAFFFYITNEAQSPYIERNFKTYLNKTLLPEMFTTYTFRESNMKLNINGYIFGNTPNATMYQGETTAISLISLGNLVGTHTVHFHGNTFVRRMGGTHRHDVMDVLPGDFQMVQLTGINKGTWLIHCHVNNHSENGMEMLYKVIDPDTLYHPR